MSILNSGIVPVAAATGGYSIDNSCRFNRGDSAYLSRTKSAGNVNTWTYSVWFKKVALVTGDYYPQLLSARSGSMNFLNISRDTDRISFNGTSIGDVRPAMQFRDPTAWYHLILAVDTTQATASNRVKFYINGELITDFHTATYPAQNANTLINSSVEQRIGAQNAGDIMPYDGYMSEIYFVDGQQLDHTSFGETGDYGEWKPIEYAGTYGTNGFYLDFKNSGSLGADVSGNSSNFTLNNIVATDQMLDSPTNNFATLNPLNGFPYLSEGNLKVYGYNDGTNNLVQSSIEIPASGKWYAEYCDTFHGGTYIGVSTIAMDNAYGGDRISYYYNGAGGYITTTGQSNDTSPSGWASTGTYIIGLAVDSDAGTIKYYLDGALQATTTLPTGDAYHFTYSNAGGGSSTSINKVFNFGQDSSFAGNKTAQGKADGNGIGDFYYTPPTGFLALCTQNLPEPTVIPSEHFNTVLYTGTGVSNAITGVGFQPDFTWYKERGVTRYHGLFDSVRGTTKLLSSNVVDEEATISGVTAFDSDGFTLGTHVGGNNNGGTYVAWNWKANGAGVSNTDGSITSTVSANVDAGFSIVSYTGNATTAQSVGHGLSQAPEMVIIKTRPASSDWKIYHASLGTAYQMRFDTAAKDNAGTLWNSTTPSSTLFYINNDGSVNSNGNGMIAYAFHSVEGYSKVGSYTGNGSSDGTFVHTGGRPAYVMIKRTDVVSNWAIYDAERDTYNVADTFLFADGTTGDQTYGAIDFTSNGFKHRSLVSALNASGGTYIYLCFFEHPFKYTNAR